MAAMEQERYAFSRGSEYETYGGCHAGFPTAVELQLQSAAATVLGAGVPGASLTRTRVVPVTSPRGRRNSSAPAGIVSILLPCVPRADVRKNSAEERKDVVVRNSVYYFSEDDDDETVATESLQPTPQHRHNPDTFQTAGSTDPALECGWPWVTLNHLRNLESPSWDVANCHTLDAYRMTDRKTQYSGIEWPWIAT